MGSISKRDCLSEQICTRVYHRCRKSIGFYKCITDSSILDKFYNNFIQTSVFCYKYNFKEEDIFHKSCIINLLYMNV